MNSDERDISILHKINEYCDRIISVKSRFGNSFGALESDPDYRDAISMNILQIGELTTHLSNGFKSAHSEIPWREIKVMRNVAAHNYEKFDNEYVWGTISDDIPALREFCQRIIDQHKE